MRYYLFDMLVHNGVNMMPQNLEKRYGVSFPSSLPPPPSALLFPVIFLHLERDQPTDHGRKLMNDCSAREIENERLVDPATTKVLRSQPGMESQYAIRVSLIIPRARSATFVSIPAPCRFMFINVRLIYRIIKKPMELAYGLDMVLLHTIPKLEHGQDGLIFTAVDEPYVIGEDHNM
jgi:hypothetical protein